MTPFFPFGAARASSRLAKRALASTSSTAVAKTIERALASAGLLTPQPGKSRTPASPRSAPVRSDNAARQAGAAITGQSSQHAFTNAAGTRAYTLHVPTGVAPTTARPLVVMLHGCTQDPDDFAAGTRMNALADRHGVLVAYPAQTARDNGSRCWNWFRRQDQLRDAGEPSIIAGIVADIASGHRVDADRVYVAGLSAGAAMAVILGRTYPDVFAAVGAHSGLAYGSAQDVPGAFAAMQGGAPASRHGGETTTDRTRDPMPTIVFHGDADRTVDARNGTAIVEDAVAGTSLVAHRTASDDVGARTFTREVFTDAHGRGIVEHWILHGGTHAWSGGDPSGSHVDALGPDASAEMLRFFLQHARS